MSRDVRLPGFVNRVGWHCSSSAVRSVLAYDGIELSEAVCFGLGSGLGFFYAREPGRSPSRRFNGRAPDLEGAFYALAGHPLRWAGAWRPELIRSALASGRPVLAQTDIFPIPYYDDAHFLGHGLVVIGLEGDEVLVADIAAEGVSRMPMRAFHAAVAADHPPLNRPFGYAAAPRLRHVEVRAMAPRAIARTVRYLLEPPTPLEGVPGMRMLADELPAWCDLEDRAWCARFGYQAIEKRGTGGGNFRALYARFLEEADLAGVPVGERAQGYRDLAGGWSALAGCLKAMAFAEDPQGARVHARDAAARLRALADDEAAMALALAADVGG